MINRKLSEEERETLKAFGAGMSDMALYQGPNRDRGELIVTALNVIEDLESLVAFYEIKLVTMRNLSITSDEKMREIADEVQL
jgi:hypothetical protein